MKKIVCLCIMLGLISSFACAMPSGMIPYGVGAKYAAMGGAGSTLVDDMAAAYYNPAGMYRSGGADLKLGLGTASNGSDQLMQVFGNMSNPAKFLADNFSNALDINGNVSAILGLSVGNMGLAVMPAGNLRLLKAKNTLGGTIGGSANSDSAFTCGYGVQLPYVGKAGAGANIKYIYNATASAAVGVAGPTTTDITNTVTSYGGMGFDIGLQGNLDVLPTAPVAFAIVYKDIAANLNGNSTVTKGTYDNLTGSQIGTTTTISDGPVAGYAVPSTIVLGASTQIPVVGLKAAIDLDSVSSGYSVTHIGFEYPVLMGAVSLRAGLISGGPAASPINMTTYGAGILGSTVNVAMISDNNDSKNNQIIADVHLGF